MRPIIATASEKFRSYKDTADRIIKGFGGINSILLKRVGIPEKKNGQLFSYVNQCFNFLKPGVNIDVVFEDIISSSSNDEVTEFLVHFAIAQKIKKALSSYEDGRKGQPLYRRLRVRFDENAQQHRCYDLYLRKLEKRFQKILPTINRRIMRQPDDTSYTGIVTLSTQSQLFNLSSSNIIERKEDNGKDATGDLNERLLPERKDEEEAGRAKLEERDDTSSYCCLFLLR